MSTLAVAKKDFHDAVRSRELWALIGLFVLFLGGATVFDMTDVPEINDDFSIMLYLSPVRVMTIVVPSAALLVSTKSIVRERSLGTVTFLLAQSHSRFDVYVGKLLGRSAVVTTAALVGYLPVLVLLSVGPPVFDPSWHAKVLVAALVLGFVYVAIGHSVSAMTESETLASVAGFGVFFLMYTWVALFHVINGQFGPVRGTTEMVLSRFSLQVVIADIIMAVYSLEDGSVNSTSVAVSGGDVPFYLQHWFAVVVLGIWTAPLLALGYRRFSRTDL